MTQQGKPGWFDDGTGVDRWWDGRGWTAYTRARDTGGETVTQPTLVVPAAPATSAVARASTSTTPSARLPRSGRTVPRAAAVVLTISALVLGVIIGSASAGSAGADASARVSRLTASMTDLQGKLRVKTAARDALQSSASTVSAEAAQLAAQKKSLDKQTDELKARSASLDARQKKLDDAESKAAAVTSSSTDSSADDSSADDSSTDGSSTDDSSTDGSSTDDSGAPAGATAQCNDGTYSYSAHHSGTCSHHGGVAEWL